MDRKCLAVVVLMLVLAAPAIARAQASIAGVVKDPSGAVLPGVTVEAASPALIEKVRSVVTRRQRPVPDRRPAARHLHRHLHAAGFNTVKREGIELTGRFTATVNAELASARSRKRSPSPARRRSSTCRASTQQRVLGKEVIDAIPTGRTPVHGAGAASRACNSQPPDVGGTNAADSWQHVIDPRQPARATRGCIVDGVPTATSNGPAQLRTSCPTSASTQELTVDYAAGSAERRPAACAST